MSAATQKVLQYLNEAHASEQALTRVLESQIAMTPAGAYRTGLEKHRRETVSHAERVATRITELGQGSNPVMIVLGVAETVVGQAIALTKTPIDLLRGSGGEEKVLKNAKDACATEALEIATYTALEQLAVSVGDDETAKLAASIRADEERMLALILREIPKLAKDVVAADVDGNGPYDIATTGAGEAVRAAGTSAKKAARKTKTATKKQARKARKVPGVAAAEGTVKGAVADASDLAIARYDSLTAAEITDQLADLSQIDLAKIDVYERKHQNRSTLLSRVETLRRAEPWAGYDELNVDEIKAVLTTANDKVVSEIRTYEQAHKSRTGVLEAADAAAKAA